MKPGDDGFFEKVGSMGGKATKKKHGKDYYSKIASISHVKRAERRAAESQPTPAE